MAFQGASSSSRSSSTRWSTYDVFLSFRGEDTRQNFTAHLHHALDRKNIYTYIDYKLPRGEEISDELLKAIESSRISIVVLSKNYASSRWCLDELMKILECKKTKQQKVLPVFYYVDPTEVRHQREVFGKALAELKEGFKDESKVERWKAALTEVAGLSGFTLGERTEAELIQEIVRDVSKVVKPKYLNDVAEHPVGMESRVRDVYDILQRVGVNDTRILGISGPGGIGKTTLAKEIYNIFTDQFENCCFLANVREMSKSEDGLIKLQETLLCEILGDWSLKVRNVDEGMGLIKKMLWSKKVLLVLDDLDQSVKVKTLLGGCDHLFGLGSIIIITTRDEHLLTTYNVHLRYKVKELDRDKALRLFCWNAFQNENIPNHEFEQLTEDVLRYAGGLPLALMVVGSGLFGRDIDYWRSALEKHKKIPPKDILETLRISYDGLEQNEKSIFLDIAFFFTGEHKTYVTEVLDSCGFFTTCGIKVLVDKSLITISERDGSIRMHDLLKDMGREIVRQESPKEPKKRSRLWFHEDVRHVLEETKGTDKIEGILLDIPEGHDNKQIRLHPKAFKKMKNLRLFINRNAQFSRGPPNYLFNEIRVLDWANYPSSVLPSNFRGNNLVEFQMRNSLIKELGGLKSKNLRLITLSGSKSLTKIPDLSSCPNLEWLDLSNCENFVEVHDSVELGMPNSLITFKNLIVMNFSGCKSLTKVPALSSCPNLEELDLSNCENLVEVHDSVELRMPNSLITFKNLTIMNFSGCKSLTKIPALSSCPNLEELDLSNCENLVKVHDSVELRMPDSLITFKNLTVMNFSGCKSLTKIPNLSSCPNLESLCLSNCENLVEVHDSVELRMPNSLITFKATECEIASNFFTNGNYFPALGRLDLSGIDIVIFPPQSVRFASLRYLGLDNCKKLEEILPLPLSIDGVTASGCTSLENFALLSEVLIKNNRTNISNFLRIQVNGCYKLLANMLPIPSWEERHSEEQNREGRYIEIEFPGKRIPSWFSYRKEAHDSNLCEIDINGPHHWNDIDEIVIYVVYGFRVGITNLEERKLDKITVEIHDGSNWTDIYTKYMTFSRMVNSDQVWMLAKRSRKLRDVSRFRIKCDIANFMVFRRVGIHFPKKHEENVRDEDHTGVLYETPFKDFGLDFMDDNENPKEDLELENDDENPKEGFGKRRRDEYDCNLEFNWYPQQKRQHSSTMGIRITELENDDEHPKEDMDLELKLG